MIKAGRIITKAGKVIAKVGRIWRGKSKMMGEESRILLGNEVLEFGKKILVGRNACW